MSDRKTLLEPSLVSPESGKAIYSPNACFMVAFFGGLFAITAFSAINSWRLGRVKRDLKIYIVVVALVLIGMFLATQWLTTSGFVAGDQSALASYNRFAWRALALFAWFACYRMHREAHRASELTSDTAPSPWIPGIVCVVLGSLALLPLAMLWI